ncbi:phosphatase PAP2 family protein [Shewanella atlantica]|uniref:undecaprenyl-diphosphate phosphatase n=1 Tax=Shewanella atlantica TaxID=271099 RepID=A0A3S0KKD9_9GAMM|nr:phosphatase PAP2 family protein [Shewanella atlantica]RTR32913.1 phosphatase PAP2 family protein [Shewanella atlantica]
MPAQVRPESLSSMKSLLYYSLAITATIFSALFLDRNIAEFMHLHSQANSLLKLLSQTPLLLEILAGLAILSCTFKLWRVKSLKLAVDLTITLILASITRVSAKYLFGRTWPETWVNDNPSWITDRIEGFHPFAEGLAYNSFPSGHALFTFALATTFWYHLPRYRPLWIAAMCAVFIGQLGQNYHYLGDLLAGATLGTFIAHMVIIATQSRRSRRAKA